MTQAVWDLSSTNQGDAVKLFKVVDIDLRKQLYEHMKSLTPSIYLQEFIAEDKAEVADNVLAGTKSELVCGRDHPWCTFLRAEASHVVRHPDIDPEQTVDRGDGRESTGGRGQGEPQCEGTHPAQLFPVERGWLYPQDSPRRDDQIPGPHLP